MDTSKLSMLICIACMLAYIDGISLIRQKREADEEHHIEGDPGDRDQDGDTSDSGTRCTTADRSECSYQIASGSDCYSHADICCNACAKYETSNSDCKFGDKYVGCSGYVTRNEGRVCLNNPDSSVTMDCCASCAPYLANPGPVTTIPNMCVDEAAWCSTIQSRQCYDPQIEKTTCCATCTRLRTSDDSCRYGDKYAWCVPAQCEQYRTECCDTC